MPITTISTASIVLAQDETFGTDNQAPLMTSWENSSFEVLSELIWGRQVGKLTFDYDSVAFKFTNLAPTIPVGAKIVSAYLRMTATATSTTAVWFSPIIVHGKDGLWDPAGTGPQWRNAATNITADCDTVVLNTSAAILVDTGVPGSTIRWKIRDNFFSRSLKAGQGVTIGAAGTLGYIDFGMGRSASAPPGNVWIEVYAQDANGLATGSILATSNTRPTTDVSTNAASPLLRFTFSGGDQISLANGQKIVAVVNGDWSVLHGGWVAVRWMAGGAGHGDFYAPGVFQIYGSGIALDNQNYPMQEDYMTIPTAGTGGTFVVWVAPRFIAGFQYNSEDFAGPLQTYITGGSYVQGDPFCVQIFRNNLFFPAGDATRRIAQVGNATYTTPTRLIVEWRERRRHVI